MNSGESHLVMLAGVHHFWLQLIVWNWSHDSTVHKGARKYIPTMNPESREPEISGEQH